MHNTDLSRQIYERYGYKMPALNYNKHNKSKNQIT